MLKIIALVLSLLTAITGYCENSKAQIKFYDGRGEEVVLSSSPQKTAVLFSSFAEMWTLAGGRVDITVGEAVERGFANDTAILVDSSAGKTINVETIIAQEADFVLGSLDVPAHVDAAQILKKAGIPCALFKVESFDDYINVLSVLCEITGDKTALDKYGTDVEKRIQAILAAVPNKAEQKRVLFIRSGSGASSMKAMGTNDHFAATMIHELGAYNIADNAKVLLDGLSIEEIIKEDPSCIFVSTMGNEEAAKEYVSSVINSAAWSALTAVKEGRVYYLPKDLFQFKPNARWDVAYKYLYDILYP